MWLPSTWLLFNADILIIVDEIGGGDFRARSKKKIPPYKKRAPEMDFEQVTQRIQDSILKNQSKSPSGAQKKILDELRDASTDVRSVTTSIRLGRLRLADLESILIDVFQNDDKRRVEVESAIHALRESFIDMEKFMKSNRKVLDAPQSRNLTSVLDEVNKILAE